jgi:hypothetical protein
LILGYALTVALIAGLIVWAVSSPSRTAESVPMPGATVTASPLPQDPAAPRGDVDGASAE